MLVALNDFVKRQTADSPYTHFEGSWDEVEVRIDKAARQFLSLPINHNIEQGVMKLMVNPTGFFASVVDLRNVDKPCLLSEFKARQEGEDPYVHVTHVGKKSSAKFVEVILYSHERLVADNEQSTDAEWEVVSINGRLTAQDQPLGPIAMARNFLHLKGGTITDYTARQFADSIIYWSTRVPVESLKEKN